jgi:hypothetical protein
MTMRTRFLAGCLASWPVVLAGCASAHSAPVDATADLACAPDRLRSIWWSEGGGPFYGAAGGMVPGPSGTYLLLEDTFRSTSIRLSDGHRSDDARPTIELTEVSGLRVASPRMVVDADGRSDYAGATDILAIGTAAPLVEIPWIVPRDASGYTRVVAHVSQETDRAFLVEQSIRFGDTSGGGRWLRVVPFAAGSAEVRIDLSGVLPLDERSYESPFTLLVDEAHQVVFVIVGRQVDAAPGIARVDLETGDVRAEGITIGDAAPLIGFAHVGEPGTELLDAALSTDGRELLLTTRDGQLQVLDAATLRESRHVEVGVAVANQETYLPSLRSPVASSAHDRFLATLDASGHVAILDAVTLAPLGTLSSAAPTEPATPEHDGEPRVMMLRFLPDGLVVATDRGIERFRCPD